MYEYLNTARFYSMRPPKETSSEPDSGRVGARAEGRVLCYKGITGIVENLKESPDTEYTGVLCLELTNLLYV